MAGLLVQFRAEDTRKIKAIQILDRLGLSLSSYLRMCISGLNRKNEILLSMKLDLEPNPSIRALNRVNHIAEEYRISDMTLEKVDAKIIEARE